MKSRRWSLPENLNLTPREIKNQYSLREFVRQIDLNKKKLKKIESLFHGNFQSSAFGGGFDFNEIREYKIGDDLRHISWNTTAKTGILHTKEYYAEKEIRSYFLIDISNSMFCGNKLEPFIKLFAVLLSLSAAFSEKIGGVFFSDKIKHHFSLSQAESQANIIFKTFMDIFNNLRVNDLIKAKEKTNIVKALDFSKQYFKKRGLVFIISDFIYPQNKNWEKAIYDSSQIQNIYSFQIFDPIDGKLPKSGYITLIDPETNERFLVNTDNKLIQENYYNLTNQRQEKLSRFFKTIGVNHMVIEKNDFT